MCSAKRFKLIARALEVFVLSSEIEFDAFSKPSWNQAGAERIRGERAYMLIFLPECPFGTFLFVPNDLSGHQRCTFWWLSWSQANAESTCFVKRKSGVLLARPHPHPQRAWNKHFGYRMLSFT